MIKNLCSVFYTLSGESSSSGSRALFLRFQGCNLRCAYCDTIHAQQKNTKVLTVNVLDELSRRIAKHKPSYVVLTGGEPLLWLTPEDIIEILSLLDTVGYKITLQIETNGSVPLYNIPHPNLSYIMDYKLPNSCMEHAMYTDNFKILSSTKDEVKFVISSTNDILRAREIIDLYSLETSVRYIWFSPCFASISLQEVWDAVLNCSISNLRMQVQLHKVAFPELTNTSIEV